MERLDDLGLAGLKIIQRPEVAFSMDTVLLAHFAQARPGERWCDLGTGCGVIPLLVAARSPISIVGLELQPDLAELAQRSVDRNGLGDHVRIVRGDLRTVTLEDLGVDRPFDAITVNPPFRPAGTGRVSPSQARALSRHELGCALGDVLRAARRLARHGGRIYLNYLTERLADLLVGLRSEGLEPKRVRLIRPSPGAVSKLVLVEGRRGGRPGLKVEPDLVIRGADGGYAPEVRAIYGTER
ncbi:MAG TPA: methyltransferase [Bacillota bacterium]|jgi:tRNA1(Val) A37 N6-methylase TrmN6